MSGGPFLGYNKNYNPLLGNPKPIDWQQLGQALWDTNLNAPIRGAYNLMQADPYTLMTDTGAAGQQAAADSFDAAGGVTAGSMPIPKPSNALTMGIKAYHGSPHSFDKFSMDKIGTGEGAQAYGHGLYFAENEGVARGYKEALKPGRGSAPEDIAARVLQATGDREGAIAELQRRLDNVNQRLVTNPDSVPPEFKSGDNNLTRALEYLKSGGDPSGSMYEVNIDADPNAFLDWDKPLSEQPEGVRKAYAQAVAGGDPLLSELMDGSPESLQMAGLFKKSSGAQAYNTFVDGNKEGFTKKLAEAGIPGIKYLDAGSRGKGVAHVQVMYKGQPHGDPIPVHAWNQVDQLTKDYNAKGYDVVVKDDLGTRNYVVFDDKLISIVRKYGIAGASAMLGYNLMNGLDKAQAATLNKADLDHRYDNFLKSGGI